jgi:hypothetical protein
MERFDNAVGTLPNAPKGAFVNQQNKLGKRREEEGREVIRVDQECFCEISTVRATSLNLASSRA